MKQFFKSSGFILFWIIALIDILATAFHQNTLQFIAKPLLLPLLILVLFFSSPPGRIKSILVAGLFFSFLGDVFLLFETSNPLFFIFGLICFLLTHLFYIFFFLNIHSQRAHLLKQKPYLIFLVALYTSGLLYLLIPKLGPLLIPVIIYAVILTLMLLSSIHVYNKASLQSSRLFITGAAFFVISDSLLAINKFYSPLAYAGFFIIGPYCIAQYLIVKGFIKKQTVI